MEIAKFHLSHWLMLVQNAGPADVAELEAALREAVKIAQEKREAQLLSWAGPYDVLVYPSGLITLVATLELKQYRLMHDSPHLALDAVLTSEQRRELEQPPVRYAIGVPRNSSPLGQAAKLVWSFIAGPFSDLEQAKSVPLEQLVRYLDVNRKRTTPLFLVQLNPDIRHPYSVLCYCDHNNPMKSAMIAGEEPLWESPSPGVIQNLRVHNLHY